MDINDRISAAKGLIEKSEFKQAVDILLSNKTEKDLNWEIFFELGKIYYITKEFTKSVLYLKKAVAYNNSDYAQLLLAKAFKANGNNFNALRLFLKLRNNTQLQVEIDNEIISMFLDKKSYIVAIKYIDKYTKQNTKLRTSILNYLYTEIDMYNFIGNFKEAKKLSLRAFNRIKEIDVKSGNIFLNEIEIADNSINLKSFPRILEIALTGNCNLKCRMCLSNFEQWKGKQLTDKQVQVLVENFKYLETVIWIGGEPLLYKKFEKLIDIANDFCIKQELVSNGLLITERLAKKIVDYNIKLTLSIDSIDKKIYENIRLGAKFDLLLNNVQIISRYRNYTACNKEFVLNAVLSRWNCQDKDTFFKLIQFADHYGFTTINIYSDDGERDSVIKEKYIKNFNLNRTKLTEMADSLNIVLNINVPLLDCNNKYSYLYEKGSEKFCLLPWKKMYVNFDNFVLVDCKCPKIGFFSTKDEQKDLINNIWNGTNMIKLRKKIVENGVSCLNKCQFDKSLRKG